MRSREIEDYKEKLKLTNLQREILVGLMLGDGHLETQNKGRTYRLKVEYSIKNREYCQHVYETFRDWVLTPPREKSINSRGHLSSNIAFSTVSHGAFRFYAQQFYQDGKKKVPSRIDKLLTPRGLAYWYMDDGSMKSNQSKGVVLNTQGFQRKEIKLLIDLLIEKFDLEASERKQKDGLQIYVSGRSYEKFVQLVDKWILPSMRYKIPKARRTKLPKK